MAWYSEWFGRKYLELYSHRDREEASRQIDQVEKLVSPARDLPVLDLACGGGRHAIELARRGYKVVGLDLSETLLEVAREAAAEEGVEIEFVHCDMRAIPFENTFGTVLNFFTSFGYFEDEEDNLEVLRGIGRALVPGGRFLIDHINREHVLANLVPEDSCQEKGRLVTQRRRFVQKTGRLEKRIMLEEGGESEEFLESVRLYTRGEFGSLAESAGLQVVDVFGALDGSEFGTESARMVVLGRRPDDKV